MKKRPVKFVVALAIAGTMLTSCASNSGWSCSKRYCNEQYKPQSPEKGAGTDPATA